MDVTREIYILSMGNQKMDASIIVITSTVFPSQRLIMLTMNYILIVGYVLDVEISWFIRLCGNQHLDSRYRHLHLCWSHLNFDLQRVLPIRSNKPVRDHGECTSEGRNLSTGYASSASGPGSPNRHLERYWSEWNLTRDKSSRSHSQVSKSSQK